MLNRELQHVQIAICTFIRTTYSSNNFENRMNLNTGSENVRIQFLFAKKIE